MGELVQLPVKTKPHWSCRVLDVWFTGTGCRRARLSHLQGRGVGEPDHHTCGGGTSGGLERSPGCPSTQSSFLILGVPEGQRERPEKGSPVLRLVESVSVFSFCGDYDKDHTWSGRPVSSVDSRTSQVTPCEGPHSVRETDVECGRSNATSDPVRRGTGFR